MRDRLLKLLSSPDYRPMTKSELARALELQPKQRSQMRQALGQLQGEGKIICGRKARWELASERTAKGAVRGIYHLNWRGNGQLRVTEVPEGSSIQVGEEIPIASHGSATALPGDEVLTSLSKKPLPRWMQQRGGKAPEDFPIHQARVEELLVRNFTQVVGTLRRRGKHGWVIPSDDNLPTFDLDPHQPLAEEFDGLPPEDSIVVLRFTGWDDPQDTPRGTLIEVVEAASDTRLAIEVMIRRRQLPTSFPQAALDEAAAFPTEPAEQDFEGRENWRERPVFTIDPIDARDFDDAIFVEARPEDQGGGWELTVHIADVSHYVAPDTAMDHEARERGNSTYLADRVIPMLPEALSNGLCSLVPNQARLTRAVTIAFDPQGKVVGNPRFFSAVIDSKRRFHYAQIQELFDSADKQHGGQLPSGDDAVLKSLSACRAMAKVLRKRRFQQGALDLDFPELKVLTDEDGNPTGYQIERSDESHQLVEECMLAANEAVARRLLRGEVVAVHRAHEDPNPTRLAELRELARDYGHQVGDLSDRKTLQKLLRAVKGKPEEQAIKIATLKSMARAHYSVESLGHYGLAKEAYTHFTSPIRRYADLIVHRSLFGRLLKDQPGSPDIEPLSVAQATAIAAHISRTERSSAEAEKESRRILLLDWLETQCHPGGVVLDGFVGEVKSRSAFVDLPELSLRGMVKLEDLPSDNYRYDRNRHTIEGRHTNIFLAPGRPIRVRPVRVDKEQGYLDLSVVD